LPGDTVQFTGTVYSNEDGSALGGSTVTLVEGADAKVVTAGPGGGFAFEVCPQATLFFRAEQANFYPMLRGIVVPETGAIRDFYLPAKATIEGALAATNEAQAPGKGLVWLSFENATVAGYSGKLSAQHGATITLDPATKAPAKADATLSGGLDFWFLVFSSTDPGKTTIELSAPSGHSCTPRTTVTDWRVDPGVITYVDADCD
jgi:predicted secreted protein